MDPQDPQWHAHINRRAVSGPLPPPALCGSPLWSKASCRSSKKKPEHRLLSEADPRTVKFKSNQRPRAICCHLDWKCRACVLERHPRSWKLLASSHGSPPRCRAHWTLEDPSSGCQEHHLIWHLLILVLSLAACCFSTRSRQSRDRPVVVSYTKPRPQALPEEGEFWGVWTALYISKGLFLLLRVLGGGVLKSPSFLGVGGGG